jgi:D-inositol-3-phosphate glycosyltransferase
VRDDRPLRMVTVYGDPPAGFLAPGGGINVFVSGVADALATAGEHVDVFSPRYPGAPPGRVDLVMHGVELGVDEMTKAWIARHMERLVERAAPWVPELARSRAVYTHYWLSGRLWSRLREEHEALRAIRWVHSFHSFGRVRARHAVDEDVVERVAWEERIIAECDVVIVNSEAERRDLLELHKSNPRGVVVVPGGYRPAQFSPGAGPYLRRRVAAPAGCAIVLFVGRLEHRKGFMAFLEVARQLRLDERFFFVLVGGRDGCSYERFGHDEASQFVADHGLARVALLPAVPHHELHLVLRSARYILLPSSYEPFGLTALEAQACGCIPIAFPVGGLTATVANGYTGMMASGPDAMVDCLCGFEDDPQRLARFQQRAPEWVRRRFSWDALVPQFRAAMLSPARDVPGALSEDWGPDRRAAVR